MNERRIKDRMRAEAGKIMPDVLANVYREIGLEPQTIKSKPKLRFNWPLGKLGTFSVGVSFLIIGALLVPTFINGPIVASAETSIKLKIIPAEETSDPAILPTIKYLPGEDEAPIFSYKIDRHGKTIALDENNNNALYAENDAAKIIAAGLGLENTLRKSPVALAMSLTQLARQTGYLKSYVKGNYIAYRISGEDATYRVRLKANLEAEFRAYFQTQLIYAVAFEDETLEEADFTGYSDFSSQMGEYHNHYNDRRSDHQHDDDRRGSGWGDDISEWMEEHHDDHHDTMSSSSQTGSNSPTSVTTSSQPDTGSQPDSHPSGQ